MRGNMNPEIVYKNLEETTQFLKDKIGGREIHAAITLGSGLGLFTDSMENKLVISYNDIPHFHTTTVAGHSGEMIIGDISGKTILALKGRIHAYEGHSFEEVVFPTRVIKSLGIKNLVLTNASGGMNPKYKEGDLVLIKDHINLTGNNPLLGPNLEKLGPRFPDMSTTWTPELIEVMHSAANGIKFPLKEGVYVGVLGPSYETPAEIKMYQALGGDMVGMSTVAEAIAARHCGLKLVGISCITNMAAGIHQGELDHADIKEQANRIKEVFVDLLKEFFRYLN